MVRFLFLTAWSAVTTETFRSDNDYDYDYDYEIRTWEAGTRLYLSLIHI